MYVNSGNHNIGWVNKVLPDVLRRADKNFKTDEQVWTHLKDEPKKGSEYLEVSCCLYRKEHMHKDDRNWTDLSHFPRRSFHRRMPAEGSRHLHDPLLFAEVTDVVFEGVSVARLALYG